MNGNPVEKLVLITRAELVDLISNCLRTALQEHASQSADEGSDILTHKDAALFLQMSQQTLYGYCHRLQIPYLKSGGDPSRKKAPNLFSKKELSIWQQNGRQLTKEQIESLGILQSVKRG